ncbi:hypothetical protein [Calothrix sp. 336/3]|uniref:hypothetical protein n=1 Tax=Calothrix sp. 336/3 TaxID=1337936 RepID=UPI000A54FC8D|nr:hypothetical protein [Calothrix sp. 336/3]
MISPNKANVREVKTVNLVHEYFGVGDIETLMGDASVGAACGDRSSGSCLG